MTDETSPPPRRILSIWLPRLTIDRWRLGEGCVRGEGRDAGPFALIAETAHGLRIEAVNDAGRAAGLRQDMALTDARTFCPHLKVGRSDPEGDRDFLERLAVWAQRWGPWSALDAPDGLVVDATAVAHLFGDEEQLLADADAAFRRRGLTARFSIAPTAGAAWALSHFGPEQAILTSRDDPAVYLSELPVAALRLESEVLTVLRRLGLKRLGDLQRIGRDALHRRFRNHKSAAANPLIRMDQLFGRISEPLLPVTVRQAPFVQRRVLEPIRHRELLDRVMADLANDMRHALEEVGQSARRLELGLWRVDGEVMTRRIELSVATRDTAHVCRLFSTRLDDVDAGFGIEMVRMCASWTEPTPLDQADLETMTRMHGTSLATCIDRLTVRLGEKAVRRPVSHASHIPERAQRWRPPLESEPVGREKPRYRTRPLKLLDRAEKIAVLYATPDGYPRRFRWRGRAHEIVRVEGPERIAPEWWRVRSTTRLRDYYRIEDGEGRRYWIYRSGLTDDGRGGPPDWFLHGLYA